MYPPSIVVSLFDSGAPRAVAPKSGSGRFGTEKMMRFARGGVKTARGAGERAAG